MNIYHFIDSKDIRNYLQKIKYKFTVPETAFLIYMNRRATLNEKVDAWQEIIDTMSDCSMGERFNMEVIPSFHRFLEKYIALVKDLLEIFYKPEDVVYTYAFYEEEEIRSGSYRKFDWVEEGNFFQDFSTALTHLKKNYMKDPFNKIRFTKQYFASTENENARKIILEMNPDLEILSVNECNILKDSQVDLFLTFEGMWFSFPTPFRRGDILLNPTLSQQPFVLKEICIWGSKELLENGYLEEDGLVKSADRTVERLSRHGDTSDMNYSACYIDEDAGKGFYIFSDVFRNYLHLERYTQSLKGEQRALAALGRYLSPDRGAEDRCGVTRQCSSLLFYGRAVQKKQEIYRAGVYC